MGKKDEQESGQDIYEREMMEELFEDDELTAEEEGFMAGYIEA